MRLSEEQVVHLIKTIRSKIITHPCEVFLYGSRTKDTFKGGDIDLLILSSPEGCELLHQRKYELLVDIKKSPLIGDRKIDLAIATPEEMKTQPFLKLIADEIIKLG